MNQIRKHVIFKGRVQGVGFDIIVGELPVE